MALPVVFGLYASVFQTRPQGLRDGLVALHQGEVDVEVCDRLSGQLTTIMQDVYRVALRWAMKVAIS